MNYPVIYIFNPRIVLTFTTILCQGFLKLNYTFYFSSACCLLFQCLLILIAWDILETSTLFLLNHSFSLLKSLTSFTCSLYANSSVYLLYLVALLRMFFSPVSFSGRQQIRTTHSIQDADIQEIYKSGMWLCLLLPCMSFLLILNSRFSLLINARFVTPHLINEWLQSPSDTNILYVNLGLVFLHNFTVTYTEFHTLFYCEIML